ncbi:MAG: hypothetical protein MUC36_02945 [Planctomycetes bacterium]|nr:hypothetical protein [Planctomycetota bacterium]
MLLLAWLAWAVFQEPELLRASDTFLLEGAAWWAGAALVLGFVGSEAALQAGPWIALLCNLLASMVFSSLIVGLVWLADQATASGSERYLGLLLRMWFCFGVLGASIASLQRMSQTVYWYVFASMQLAVFMSLSVKLASSMGELATFLAGGMAGLASVLQLHGTPNQVYAET